MREKGFSAIILFVVGIVILSLLIVGGSYYIKQTNSTKQNNTVITPTPSKTSTSIETKTSTQTSTLTQTTELKDCSASTCPEGYVCDKSQPGGMTPQGFESGTVSGDLKCHKICKTDADCPAFYSKCSEKNLTAGDIVLNQQMCVKL